MYETKKQSMEQLKAEPAEWSLWNRVGGGLIILKPVD